MIKTEWYMLINGTASKTYPYIREIESRDDLRMHEQLVKKKLKWPYDVVFQTIKDPDKEFIPPPKKVVFENTFNFITDISNLIR